MQERKRIIIHEDDQGIIDALKLILNDNKYDTLFIQDATKLISEIIHFNPSIVFLDLSIHNTFNLTPIKEIKKLKKVPRIILMSGNANLHEIALKYETEYLAKPFNISDFDQILELS